VIRIIGVQRNDSASKEFILLQNQGSLRINLKGHLVLSESAIVESDLSYAAHVFSDDCLIPPGMYVLLSTGSGESRWTRTKEGAMLYYVFMNRSGPVWDRTEGPVHVLSLQHTYAERGPALLMR
jgi:hypothetical protein